MELSTIIPHIEALIFASDKPLTALDIVELINNAFGFMEERISLDQVESAMEGIIEKYNAEFYPFEVRESGGGFQFLTKKEFYKTVAQLNGDKFLKRLSNAALETLAIIAYKQPVTKGEVEAIRGVNSDYSVQKLLEKELIVITGRNEELPGKPLVYATSKSFMDYFGINSTDDLPKIKEVLADQVIQGTLITDAFKKTAEAGETLATDNKPATLIVAGTGELLEQHLTAYGEQEAAFREHGSFPSNSTEQTFTTNDEDRVKRDEDAEKNDLSQSSKDELKEE